MERTTIKSKIKQTRKSFFILFFLIFMVLLFSITGCSRGNEAEPSRSSESTSYQEKGVIFEYLKTPVTTIDPAYVQNDSEIMIAKLIFQGLVKENQQGETVPCIARDWEVSPDGLTYTFHLNKGVLFHNGKEIKADDFKFSWERVLRLRAPASYLFANIQGAETVLSGGGTLVSGITALNEYILQIKLNHRQNNFINLLTHPAGAVLDRYELVEQGVHYAKAGSMKNPALMPSGAGPFQLIEWIGGRSLTLGRNASYFGEKPSIFRLEFSFAGKTKDALLEFLAGNIHILQDINPIDMTFLPKTETLPDLVDQPLRQFRYVGINDRIRPFNNKGVRDAVLYSLNAGEILQAARGKGGAEIKGTVTDYWYDQAGQDQAPISYNKNLAMQSLVQAGYPEGANLPEISLYCGSTEEDQIVAKKMMENLASVGLKVKIHYLSQKDLRQAIKDGQAAFYTRKYSAFSNELDDFFQEEVNSRWQKTFVNSTWDQLLTNAVQQDQAGRFRLYRQLEKEIMAQSRIRYLYSYRSSVAVSQNVDNFQLGRANNVIYEEIRLKQ
ncbi:ABC transporter substrate-binding protein [Dehalobacterium formicoaceticum]|uniref:ABC transporter substrate-binding protein n=1 Tax=Dehalobacterium formicoaceticum TaxID=51515 RepID=A0ABT1Y735_9FIRM|nr:ABC transporter substrate-binding protein [Dehalobacterium formicoaceticum]MCR6546286.1 ABC transporter substrate-binding protein [Dehalobacterium formicoaceticum]